MTPETRGRAWADLFTEELSARSAQHRVTRRALTYIECGLPLDQALDALKLNDVAWDDRVTALLAWETQNRADADTFVITNRKDEG